MKEIDVDTLCKHLFIFASNTDDEIKINTYLIDIVPRIKFCLI